MFNSIVIASIEIVAIYSVFMTTLVITTFAIITPVEQKAKEL